MPKTCNNLKFKLFCQNYILNFFNRKKIVLCYNYVLPSFTSKNIFEFYYLVSLFMYHQIDGKIYVYLLFKVVRCDTDFIDLFQSSRRIGYRHSVTLHWPKLFVIIIAIPSTSIHNQTIELRDLPTCRCLALQK